MDTEETVHPIHQIQNKFEIIGARAQNGKTNIVIQMIETSIQLNPNSLHIVCTQNTSCNQQQFYHRIPQEIVFSVGSFRHNDMKDLRKIVNFKQSLVVTVCCNTTQINAILETCILLQEKENKYYDSVYLYIDEIHLYIKMAKQLIETICEIPIVKKIVGLTATPLEIIELQECDEKWTNIKCTDLTWLESNFMDKNYFSLQQHDYTFVEFETVKEKYNEKKMLKSNFTVDYASFVLDTFSQNFFSPFNFTFVPSDVKVTSHYQMKDMIFSKCPRSVVLILNGSSKSLYTESNTEIKIQDSVKLQKQPSEIISDLLVQHNLLGRPLFITGHNCIQIGISLASETTGPFTGSIISCASMLKNKDALYQIVARTTGNMLHWDTFQKKTTIYCPQIVREIVVERENNIFNIFQMSRIERESLLTRENYFTFRRKDSGYSTDSDSSGKWKKHNDYNYIEFDNQQEAIDYIYKNHGVRTRRTDEFKANHSYMMTDPETGEKMLPSNEYIKSYFSLKESKPRKIQNNRHKWVVIERKK